MMRFQNPRAPSVNSSDSFSQRCNNYNLIKPSVARRGPCWFCSNAGVNGRGIFLGIAFKTCATDKYNIDL